MRENLRTCCKNTSIQKNIECIIEQDFRSSLCWNWKAKTGLLLVDSGQEYFVRCPVFLNELDKIFWNTRYSFLPEDRRLSYLGSHSEYIWNTNSSSTNALERTLSSALSTVLQTTTCWWVTSYKRTIVNDESSFSYHQTKNGIRDHIECNPANGSDLNFIIELGDLYMPIAEMSCITLLSSW